MLRGRMVGVRAARGCSGVATMHVSSGYVGRRTTLKMMRSQMMKSHSA